MAAIKNPHVETLKRLLHEEKNISVSGLSGSVQTFLLAEVLEDVDRPCLVVLPDRKGAERLFSELRFFMGVEKDRL